MKRSFVTKDGKQIHLMPRLTHKQRIAFSNHAKMLRISNGIPLGYKLPPHVPATPIMKGILSTMALRYQIIPVPQPHKLSHLFP